MLEDIRVVDCSTDIAGPYCTKLLADAGADVVKVEPASGDPLRSWGSGALFEFLNTSKRSVTVGPTDPSFDELCAGADLVVGPAPAAPLDAATLRTRHPGLVVTSITPFGLDGPWAGWAATEFTLQAWCGSTGSRGEPAEPPLAAGGRIGEWMAGTYAAVATIAALHRARRTGHGELIDVATLDAMTVSMNTYTSVFAEFLGWPPLRRPTRTIEIPSIEPSADGYTAFTTNSAQQFADFLVLIDRPDLLEDKELALHLGRFKRRAEFVPIIHEYTTRHTTAQLLERAELLRIPSGPVGNGETVTGFDQFVERKVFVENPGGRFVQPRIPYRISGVEPPPFSPAPTVGEHDGAIDWQPRRPPTPGAGAAPLPLTGTRILDCTAWWAGPAATHVLACLGADVIKVESVSRPDLMRYTSTRRPPEDGWWEWGPLFHGANNGKRGITLDLTQPEGRALLVRLLEHADVLLENFTPRVMEQFDLGWDTVHAANDRLVMVRLPAYGLDGPWRDRTGFAQTMEGITGMAWVTGRPEEPPLLPRGACDPLAAMHAVFATFLALDERDRRGGGRLVEAPMIEAALNMAAEQVVEFSASGRRLERTGNRGPGAAPQGVYRAAGDEEWLALAVATDEQWALLRRELGDPDWASDPALATVDGRRAQHDRLDEELTRWCASQDARATAERLAAAGVPAGEVIDARDVAHNPQMLHRGLFEVEHHPVTGEHPIPTLPFRFRDREGGWLRRPTPTLGEHNDEVLGDLLGLDADELGALRAAAVIGDRPRGS